LNGDRQAAHRDAGKIVAKEKRKLQKAEKAAKLKLNPQRKKINGTRMRFCKTRFVRPPRRCYKPRDKVYRMQRPARNIKPIYDLKEKVAMERERKIKKDVKQSRKTTMIDEALDRVVQKCRYKRAKIN